MLVSCLGAWMPGCLRLRPGLESGHCCQSMVVVATSGGGVVPVVVMRRRGVVVLVVVLVLVAATAAARWLGQACRRPGSIDVSQNVVCGSRTACGGGSMETQARVGGISSGAHRLAMGGEGRAF